MIACRDQAEDCPSWNIWYWDLLLDVTNARSNPGAPCRIYMTFIISQILSPVLPVALNVGQMNAMERLKKRGVNCLNAKRIAISGKV